MIFLIVIFIKLFSVYKSNMLTWLDIAKEDILLILN